LLGTRRSPILVSSRCTLFLDGLPRQCQGLLASGRMDHFVALLVQRLHHELANEGIVLDDEYSHRRLPNPEI
jgi:hypothetical protein